MLESSKRSPPHLFLYLVLIQRQKYGNKLIALPVLRTSELLNLLKIKFNLTMILTQARLNQDYINMSMLCNINPKSWLTFPFEFSSMTHPIGFEVFPAWVSPHVQPISIKVLTLEHQSNLTPCQLDQRRHFNPNTMLDLKCL